MAQLGRGTSDHPYAQGSDMLLWPEQLALSARWKHPRTIFVNGMGDLFHAAVPADFIFEVFAAMLAALQHRFQILTKRHVRLQALTPRLP